MMLEKLKRIVRGIALWRFVRRFGRTPIIFISSLDNRSPWTLFWRYRDGTHEKIISGHAYPGSCLATPKGTEICWILQREYCWEGSAEMEHWKHHDYLASFILDQPDERTHRAVAVGSALNGVGMIDGKPVRFRIPDYTNEDYGPEISDDDR